MLFAASIIPKRKRAKTPRWKKKEQMTPHQNETNANKALADWIEKVMHGRQTHPESTGILEDFPCEQPNITITAPGRSPVVIEAECEPVRTAEEEAKKRFQTPRFKNQSRPAEAVLALIYPQELRKTNDLKSALCPDPPALSRFLRQRQALPRRRLAGRFYPRSRQSHPLDCRFAKRL